MVWLQEAWVLLEAGTSDELHELEELLGNCRPTGELDPSKHAGNLALVPAARVRGRPRKRPQSTMLTQHSNAVNQHAELPGELFLSFSLSYDEHCCLLYI
jgi:hypothetical protein